GIGKTQTVLEYAYHYQQEYQAVLWMHAESREALTADFVSLATLLDLPGTDEPDPERLIRAVKGWFQTHTGWLLIFDNADDLTQLAPFLPAGSGHVLLTTRARTTEPLAESLPLPTMPVDEGALFLLRRVKRLIRDAPL